MAVRIQVNEYFIQLLADSRDPAFLNLIDKIEGIEKMRSNNTYRCSLRKLPEVLHVLRGITAVEQIPAGLVYDLYMEEMQRRSYTQSLKDNGPDTKSDWLWPHQCLGIDLAQVNRRFNFYYDTRTGKTLMCLQILYDRLKAGIARRCLVICPSNIIQAWLKDASEHFPELRVVAYYGDEKKKHEALTTPAHIVLWSTEQVANTVDILLAANFNTCIFDESSKVKSYKTEIAKAMRKLALTIPSWYNLSATPAPNGEHEYYTQMMCLDPYVFNTSITKFETKYFDDTSRNKAFKKLVIKRNMYQEFMSKVQDYSIYVDQAVMPTAGKEWHVVPLNLEPATTELYSRMRTDMCAQVEGVVITADMAAAMRAKLNQITSGFLMDTEARKENAINRKLCIEQESTEIYRTGDRSRILCLSDLLGQLNEQGAGKVVIWANYTEEFRMLEELLNDSARYVRGGTSIADKEQWIYREFKQGSLQYLVCHPLSVGMGINLTEAHTAIYYSLNDSWEAFKQSSERIYGHIAVQPNVCHYYIIQAVGTVDELIYKNLMNKRDMSTGFLDHLRSGAI